MTALRWVLLLPIAVAVGMLGSLAGGVVGSIFSQTAADTGSAFLGPFAFVFALGLVAPSKRQQIGMAATALIALLAVTTFALSTFTNIEEFVNLPETARMLSPVAQFLGALYALFIFPPFIIRGATLEDLWRETRTAGTLTGMLGVALAGIGLIAGFTGHGWLTFQVGLGVVGLAVLTWLFAFLHPLVRLSRAKL